MAAFFAVCVRPWTARTFYAVAYCHLLLNFVLHNLSYLGSCGLRVRGRGQVESGKWHWILTSKEGPWGSTRVCISVFYLIVSIEKYTLFLRSGCAGFWRSVWLDHVDIRTVLLFKCHIFSCCNYCLSPVVIHSSVTLFRKDQQEVPFWESL